MPKRWGSTSKNGRIALNPELIRAPSVCVDYVIAHEMCHFKHPHHGAAFYTELEKTLSKLEERQTKAGAVRTLELHTGSGVFSTCARF